jgi:hypothetical protein
LALKLLFTAYNFSFILKKNSKKEFIFGHKGQNVG